MKCKKCSNKFRRGQIRKSIWSFRSYAPIECDKCNTTHYVNIATRLVTGLFIVAPSIFSVITRTNFIRDFVRDFGVFNSIFLYLCWVALVIWFTPFYARYYVEGWKRDESFGIYSKFHVSSLLFIKDFFCFFFERLFVQSFSPFLTVRSLHFYSSYQSPAVLSAPVT